MDDYCFVNRRILHNLELYVRVQSFIFYLKCLSKFVNVTSRVEFRLYSFPKNTVIYETEYACNVAIVR